MIKRETKKDIFDHFDMEQFFFAGRMGELKFLSGLYDLKKLPSYDPRHKNAEEDIGTHVYHGDYQGNFPFEEERFELLADDEKFLKFIARMAHPLVHPDAQQAQRIITIANDWLKVDGWEFYPDRAIAGGTIYGYRETMAVQKPKEEEEVASIWETGKLRFFISHRDVHKKNASEFSNKLSPYGKSGFVAHDNIESNSVWKKEIMKALQTMDACICYLTSDFHESVWTNQEVGYAIAKGAPIYFYSIDGSVHKGFKYDQQAFKKGFFDLIEGIKKDFQGHPKFKRIFIDNFISARDGSFFNAKNRFFDLVGLEFSDKEIEEIISAFFMKSKYGNQLNAILTDSILSDHQKNPRLKDYTLYREYLEQEILNKHSANAYYIELIDERNVPQIKDRRQKE